ncbi:MAG: hypothetical protein RL226_2410 [Bacteroidota bacterium]|jgi:LysM repeat protein
MHRYLLTFVSLTLVFSSWAGEGRLTRSQYIDQWKDEAVRQMAIHRIPASITLAQAILESGDGNSELAREANNHFGIKCHDWKGKKVYHDDDAKGECFRKYDSAHESFEDHSVFLKKPRYASLFELDILDYKGWAKGLKKCGYATNPKYPDLLIGLIEDFGLQAYDDEGTRLIDQGKVEPTVSKKERKKAGGLFDKNEKLPDVTVANHRQIALSANRIKYITAKEGDTYESIAKELDLMPWQIWKYNDLDKHGAPVPGQRLYIQPKRNQGSEDWHVLGEGETLMDVSNTYGIKYSKLLKKNNLPPNAQPPAGTRLSLKKQLKK